MVNFQRKNLPKVVSIMIMLTASPLAVTYINVEGLEDENDEITYCPIPPKSTSLPKIAQKTILTENIVDGKLQVRSYNSLQTELSEEGLNKFLMVDVKTNNWVIVKKVPYNSGIIIYDGEISNSGKSESEKDQESDNLHYRVIISGKRFSKSHNNSSTQPLINSELKIPKIDPGFGFEKLKSEIPRSVI